jgi:5-methylcytosine-specific restriction protein A
MRNPDWVRDEVILAMDLYIHSGRRQLPAEDAAVIRLSALLNRLPIHPPAARVDTFRNPNGVSMILGNFLGIDPGHETSGLSRNNRLQEEVWGDYAEQPTLLRQTAQAIERACEGLQEEDFSVPHVPEEEVFPEGNLLTRLHIIRERNPRVVEKKLEQTLALTGRLGCEVCGFDFARVYGRLGEGYAECHHIVPLSELPDLRATRLSDLAIVCANCHRVLHRARPVLTPLQLKTFLLRAAQTQDLQP